MVKSKVIDACVEGDKLRLVCRKFSALIPEHNEIIDKKVFRYKLSTNALAQIIIELNPKTFRISPKSLLNKGDSIAGRVIECLCTKPIQAYDAEIKKRTSDHQVQFIHTRSYSFAQIKVEF